jgi:hypothetical protein
MCAFSGLDNNIYVRLGVCVCVYGGALEFLRAYERERERENVWFFMLMRGRVR